MKADALRVAALLAAFFVLGAVLVNSIPALSLRFFPGASSKPNPAAILGTVLALSLLTVAFLYVALRRWGFAGGIGGKPASRKLFLLAVAYNVLLVALKFGWPAVSLYDDRLEGFLLLSAKGNWAVWTIAAVFVFFLYFCGFSIVARFARRRLVNTAKEEKGRLKALPPIARSAIYTAAIAALVWIVMSALPYVLTVIPVINFLMIFNLGSIEYLMAVFAGWRGVALSVALAILIRLSYSAFVSLIEDNASPGQAAALTSFFWFGAGLILVYHALWIVYAIALTTLWPLRSISAK